MNGIPIDVTQLLPLVRDGGGIAVAFYALWQVNSTLKLVAAEMAALREAITRTAVTSPADAPAPTPLAAARVNGAAS